MQEATSSPLIGVIVYRAFLLKLSVSGAPGNKLHPFAGMKMRGAALRMAAKKNLQVRWHSNQPVAVADQSQGDATGGCLHECSVRPSTRQPSALLMEKNTGSGFY